MYIFYNNDINIHKEDVLVSCPYWFDKGSCNSEDVIVIMMLIILIIMLIILIIMGITMLIMMLIINVNDYVINNHNRY